jgi:hypothetical protein
MVHLQVLDIQPRPVKLLVTTNTNDLLIDFVTLSSQWMLSSLVRMTYELYVHLQSVLGLELFGT